MEHVELDCDLNACYICKMDGNSGSQYDNARIGVQKAIDSDSFT